jgi:drug/metabolite transporter (DMT)-like permease
MRSQRQAYSYAIAAVMIWTTVAAAFKLTLRHLDYIQLLFYAAAISLLVLFAIAAAQRKLRLLTTYSTQDYIKSALLGFLNPFLYYIVLFKAYALLPAQRAQPLNYTWPIMVALLSIPLLRQKITLQSILAILLSFFGVLIISTQGDLLTLGLASPQGVLLALSSALIWAVFWIYNLRDDREIVTKLLLNFMFGLLFITVSLPLLSNVALPNSSGLLGATYVGFFEMGVTFVLWLKALQLSTTTAQVSNLIYVVPFISLLVIHIVVGEIIQSSTIVGLIFIVTGIVLQRYRDRLHLKS